MIPETFLTIENETSFESREKASRFFALAIPVRNADEADAAIERIKKKYHDATHHCYAFRIITDDVLEKSSDAGEPNGTAGKPILQMIQKYQLFNILVVVVRWFGGVKLGTGGLVRAYSSSVDEVLRNCRKIERVMMTTVAVSFPHEATNAVMHTVSKFQGKIKFTEYDTGVKLTILLPKSVVHDFDVKIVEATRGKAVCQMSDEIVFV